MLTTRSGKPIHPIGIGTWDIASTFHPAEGEAYRAKPVYGNEEQEIEAIQYSLECGQNHIHCAELYGAFYTDEVVGSAIAKSSREDLFITDTLWKSSVRTGRVKPTVELMLKKLKTPYLDALYIHAPYPHWEEAVPQIDQLIDNGVIRYFGVSNFTVEQMAEAQSLSRHPVSLTQVHFNALHKTGAGLEFRTFCSTHRIQIVAYQPTKRQEIATHPVIQKIAASHNATPNQIALAWLVKMGALPIPKSTNKAHIHENLKALQVNLTDHDIHLIERI